MFKGFKLTLMMVIAHLGETNFKGYTIYFWQQETDFPKPQQLERLPFSC